MYHIDEFFLKLARMRAGVKQTDLARKLGIKQATLSNMEKRAAKCSIWNAQRFLNAIGYELIVQRVAKSGEEENGRS